MSKILITSFNFWKIRLGPWLPATTESKAQETTPKSPAAFKGDLFILIFSSKARQGRKSSTCQTQQPPLAAIAR